MTVTDLEPMIYRCIENWAAGRRHERIGLVTSYDPKTYTAKVMFQPEQLESGQIPIETLLAGNNYGVVAGPVTGDGKKTGDQVIVRYQEGDFESGKIAARLHSDVDMPPMVESGELAAVSQFNSSIKMAKDGSTTIATTEKQADGQTNNTAPNLTHSTTAGNYLATAIKSNNKGGKMTHTATDGNQVVHSITMDPTSGTYNATNSVTHQVTDGTNTHTMILDLLANKLTHKSSGGSSSHSIVLDLVNGIIENTTASHSRTAATTITDTAPTLNHNGNTSITGNLGVSGLASLLGGLGTGAFSVASDGAGGQAQASEGLFVTNGLSTDTMFARSMAQLPIYTIAGLAGIMAPVKGMIVYLADTMASAAPTFNAIPVGGGAMTVNCMVAYDGTSWRYC